MTVVPFTTSDVDAPLFRIVVQPSETTGLAETSRLMIAELARRAGAADPQVLGNQLAVLYEGAAALSTSLNDPSPWAHARAAAHTLIDRAASRDDGD
ncbi:hypothetical protein MAHJHV61_48550 [Mycobacterium avium subsp. hominissuis]|nr:hypothetical protein L838_4729 [Mycobacterium avium MAV_120709_2344]QNR36680.1 hypothetical protein BJP76_08645 [Mycobacterium avium subsp. hominissuis]